MRKPSAKKHFIDYLKLIGPGTFIDRTKVMLVPLIGLLIPLFKVMPIVYRWRFRSKIYRWYKKLADVDPELKRDNLALHLDEYLTRLSQIEAQVCQTSVLLAFSNELYHLRLHIEMLRNKLVHAASDAGGSENLS